MSDTWHPRLATPNRRRAAYGRFSADEMARRADLVRGMMADEGLDALVLYGSAGFEAVNLDYLANYRPPFATYLCVFPDPAEPSTLFVGLSNHVQYAREVSEADEVRISLPDPPGAVADRLRGSVPTGGRVGVVRYGSRYALGLPHEHHVAIESALDVDLVNVTAAFEVATSVRSEEELDRIRKAATLTDRGMEALAETAEPGVTEQELQRAIQESLLEAGGALGTRFICSAPMEGAEPGEPLPWKHPSSRTLEAGDVITTEISVAVGGYRSQLHRPFAVGRPPTDTYEELFDLAEQAYHAMVDAVRPGNGAADVHAALEPVEASPHKIYDVCLHGYGNGYQPPFVGTTTSNYWPGGPDPVTEAWTFEPGQLLVVQPNVVTTDERHGLQLGSAIIVQDGGPEVLQQFPLEFGEL